MNTHTNSENLNESVYKSSKTLVFGLILAAVFSFALGFVLNFSVEDKLISLIETNVKYNKQCPTQYKRLDIGYFLPKIRLFDVSVSSRCIKTQSNLKLSRIESSFSFPSFSPLGLSLESKIADKYSKIDITSVHAVSDHHFKIHSNKINSKTFAPFLKDFKLAGNFKIDANIATKKKNLEDLAVKVESKDFSIPSQMIQGFDLPTLNLGNFLLKAKSLSKKKIEIEELVIGKSKSPIRAKISGTMDLDKYNMMRSKIDLIANVKFSASFIESFSILNLFLDPSKADKQGFYSIQINGTLSNPGKPKILAPNQ